MLNIIAWKLRLQGFFINETLLVHLFSQNMRSFNMQTVNRSCLRVFSGVSWIPAWQLLSWGDGLQVCPPFRQHNDRPQWQHGDGVYGLHKGPLLQRQVQILPPSCTSAGQDQSSPTPGQSGHGRRCHGEHALYCTAHLLYPIHHTVYTINTFSDAIYLISG